MEKAQHKNKKRPEVSSLRANDCASRFRSRPQWISLARSPEQPLRSFTSYSASSRQSRRFADPWLRAGWPASRRKEKRRRPLIAQLLNKDHARHASLSFARRSAVARHPHLVRAALEGWHLSRWLRGTRLPTACNPFQYAGTYRSSNRFAQADGNRR